MPERPSARTVLEYLANMAEVCRRTHRHDLEEDYNDAWETAALAIYGPLPHRAQIPLPRYPDPPKRELTGYQREMLASPLRKVIMRVGDDEMLECGHKQWHPLDDQEKPAKRRRCSECMRQAEAKRSPENATPAESESKRA